MSVKNSKLLTVTGGFTNKPVTILVEIIKPLGEEPLFSIETLDGVYKSREEFEDALTYWEKGYAHDNDEKKKWKLIYLKIPGAQKLVEVLKEVLEATGVG